MNSQKIYNWIGQTVLISLILRYFIKISYVVGSYHMFFSCAPVILPVAGLYTSLPCLAFIFIVRSFNTLLNPAFFAMHYLPGFVGALSMRFNKWFVSVLVPAICMLFFILHPVAGQVWIYSLYWFIPMIVHGGQYVFNWQSNRFLQALRSTFIAHAIGSVSWAYLKPMTVSQWQLLLPVVMVERLMYAGSIAIVCIIVDYMIASLPAVAQKTTINSALEL